MQISAVDGGGRLGGQAAVVAQQARSQRIQLLHLQLKLGSRRIMAGQYLATQALLHQLSAHAAQVLTRSTALVLDSNERVSQRFWGRLGVVDGCWACFLLLRLCQRLLHLQVPGLLARLHDQRLQTLRAGLLHFLGLVVGRLQFGIPGLQALHLALRHGVVSGLAFFLGDGTERLQRQGDMGCCHHMGHRSHYFFEAAHHGIGCHIIRCSCHLAVGNNDRHVVLSLVFCRCHVRAHTLVYGPVVVVVSGPLAGVAGPQRPSRPVRHSAAAIQQGH
ncbi:hypothetical protein [Comamonas koreensis]|uniref:Uncharacterized protein n=1 Tax=Comamonas koreensis TaxID=160825 RepID=A0AAW4XY07_9BURK|nr:hypothetical protein [Comamonas koreensis]MCD2165531.1 hypothetical protein [Comamonas koreensis]